MNITISVKRRYWMLVSKQPNNRCWEWIGSKDRDGYGRLWTGPGKSKFERAHRIAWRLKSKRNPGSKLVCHKCDNPSCVNPRHLFLSDAHGNWHDMLTKGRGVFIRGEAHPTSKITTEAVLEIRRGDISIPEIIAKYGLSRVHIWRIRKRQRWAHVQ